MLNFAALTLDDQADSVPDREDKALETQTCGSRSYPRRGRCLLWVEGAVLCCTSSNFRHICCTCSNALGYATALKKHRTSEQGPRLSGNVCQYPSELSCQESAVLSQQQLFTRAVHVIYVHADFSCNR